MKPYPYCAEIEHTPQQRLAMKAWADQHVYQSPNVSGVLAALSVCIGFWGAVALALWGLML